MIKLNQNLDVKQSSQVLIVPIMDVMEHPYAERLMKSDLQDISLYRGRHADEPDVYVVDLSKKHAYEYVEGIRRTAGKLARTLQQEGITDARLVSGLSLNPSSKSAVSEDDSWLGAWMEGWLIGQYQFTKYRARKHEQVTLHMDQSDWTSFDYAQLQTALTSAMNRAAANALARDLVNEPANVLVPSEMVNRVVDHFSGTSVQVQVYTGEELVKRHMIGLLTVGAGSVHESAMIELRYTTDSSLPLTALIGKGVTFDMGGMNVKSGSDISDARMDMGGAAAVIGAMDLLQASQANANVVALIPVVENVPDANAVLPSSVITYPNGISVQIGNTDGEGRLIIADALLHAANLQASQVIDIATLTGNVGAALGLGIAGIWGDQEIRDPLIQCGERCGERLWSMPLMDEYEVYLKSNYADLNNTSSLPLAGAITAALFIRRFVVEGMRWCHIDMAGTSQYKSDTGYAEAGASGYGARLLADYIMEHTQV